MHQSRKEGKKFGGVLREKQEKAGSLSDRNALDISLKL